MVFTIKRLMFHDVQYSSGLFAFEIDGHLGDPHKKVHR